MLLRDLDISHISHKLRVLHLSFHKIDLLIRHFLAGLRFKHLLDEIVIHIRKHFGHIVDLLIRHIFERFLSHFDLLRCLLREHPRSLWVLRLILVTSKGLLRRGRHIAGFWILRDFLLLNLDFVTALIPL